MRWLDKSRDITLPTKVRLVKAMVFPVVMYGCESWNVIATEGSIPMFCLQGVPDVPREPPDVRKQQLKLDMEQQTGSK